MVYADYARIFTPQEMLRQIRGEEVVNGIPILIQQKCWSARRGTKGTRNNRQLSNGSGKSYKDFRRK